MTGYRLIPFSGIEARPFEEWQYMNCPECGTLCVPYGGFGEGLWATVGKYGCYKGCHHVWYADPITGKMYERGSNGRLRPASVRPVLTYPPDPPK
jgi:hypothetical protein